MGGSFLRLHEGLLQPSATPYEVNEILYVGDRLDNDIGPAASMGLQTALIRRGPWAFIQQNDIVAENAPTMQIDSFANLPARIAELNSAAR